MKKGDKDATSLYEEYNNMQMPTHEFLKNEDIEKILLYIEYASKSE